MLRSRDRTVKVLNDTQKHFYEQIATSCWNTMVLTQTFDFDDVSSGKFAWLFMQLLASKLASCAGWEDRGDSSDRICCHSDRNKMCEVLGFWGFGDWILCVCFSSPFGVGFLDQHQIPPIWCSGFNGTQSRQAKQDTHNKRNFRKATTRTKVLVANELDSIYMNFHFLLVQLNY